MGAPFRQPEWSALTLIEAPHFVARAHAAFVAAGAEVLTTSNYAVVPSSLGAARFAAEGSRLTDLAGGLARAAAARAERPIRVAGSLPPLFGSYRPDRFDPAAAEPVLARLVDALDPHVDLWLAETLSSTAEARSCRSALRADARPVWLSFTLDDDGSIERPTLRSGETIAAAVEAAVELGAEALLFNCSQAELMAGAVTLARAAPESPDAGLEIGVYANALPPQAKDYEPDSPLDVLRRDLDPTAYLDLARTWVERGATIIGGCCGIGPAHIAALRRGLAPQGRVAAQGETQPE